MKLKSLVASLLLATSLGASAEALTLSPVYTGLVIAEATVYALATTIAPTAITSGALKEQLAVVKGDAVNFLAGDEATEVLMITISKVREDAQFAELSDEEIATLIVETLK